MFNSWRVQKIGSKTYIGHGQLLDTIQVKFASKFMVSMQDSQVKEVVWLQIARLVIT